MNNKEPVWIELHEGWIVAAGEKVCYASEDHAALRLANFFKHTLKFQGIDVRIVGISKSATIDQARAYGVPAGVPVHEIIDDAVNMVKDNSLYYKARFRQFCDERGFRSKPTKKKTVHLAAITRMDYSVDGVEVPEGMSDNEVSDYFYDEVDGSDYNDDVEYWERGHCWVE